MPIVQVIHDESWDWEILVLDGEKVSEGHSLSIHDWRQLVEALGADFEEVEVDDITESEYYQ